jgi:hypothetical protein
MRKLTANTRGELIAFGLAAKRPCFQLSFQPIEHTIAGQDARDA